MNWGRSQKVRVLAEPELVKSRIVTLSMPLKLNKNCKRPANNHTRNFTQHLINYKGQQGIDVCVLFKGCPPTHSSSHLQSPAVLPRTETLQFIFASGVFQV
jgi:hypothetical protein